MNQLKAIPDGAKTAYGITNVITKKIVAVYPSTSRKAAIQEQERLDGAYGKSIYAAWEYTKEELEAMGFFIPLGCYDAK